MTWTWDIEPGTLAAPLAARSAEADMIQDRPEMTGSSRTRADMHLLLAREDKHLGPRGYEASPSYSPGDPLTRGRSQTRRPSLVFERQRININSRKEHNNILMDIRPVHMSSANASAEPFIKRLSTFSAVNTAVTAPSIFLSVNHQVSVRH